MNTQQDPNLTTPYHPPQYKYKGQVYRLLGTVKHKNEITRNWEIMALYEDASGARYTRHIDEFHKRFTEVRDSQLDPLHG